MGQHEDQAKAIAQSLKIIATHLQNQIGAVDDVVGGSATRVDQVLEGELKRSSILVDQIASLLSGMRF